MVQLDEVKFCLVRFRRLVEFFDQSHDLSDVCRIIDNDQSFVVENDRSRTFVAEKLQNLVDIGRGNVLELHDGSDHLEKIGNVRTFIKRDLHLRNVLFLRDYRVGAVLRNAEIVDCKKGEERFVSLGYRDFLRRKEVDLRLAQILGDYEVFLQKIGEEFYDVHQLFVFEIEPDLKVHVRRFRLVYLHFHRVEKFVVVRSFGLFFVENRLRLRRRYGSDLVTGVVVLFRLSRVFRRFCLFLFFISAVLFLVFLVTAFQFGTVELLQIRIHRFDFVELIVEIDRDFHVVRFRNFFRRKINKRKSGQSCQKNHLFQIQHLCLLLYCIFQSFILSFSDDVERKF